MMLHAAEDFLPLIGEATRPAQPPRFTIHVQNLRALRRVSWQPDQVCALIGANATGRLFGGRLVMSA